MSMGPSRNRPGPGASSSAEGGRLIHGTAGSPAVEICSLSLSYPTGSGEAIRALNRVDLKIPETEFVSIVGRSGCGKSTLLRVLAGLLPRFSGEVSLWGTPLDGPQSDVAMVFQQAVLLPWRTVLQNVVLPLQVEGRLDSESERKARSLLRRVDLEGFEERYPHELSGGMQQRTSIARALVREPKLLLMDEPFGALDALTREQLNLALQELWMGSRKTVVFVTHSVAEAVFLSDRVIVLSPRPGEVAGIFEVDLPRPRALEVMTTAEFGDRVRSIRTVLDRDTKSGDGVR